MTGQPDRWMRLAIGLWAAFAVAAAVKAWEHPYQHANYFVYSAAARRWQSEEPLYNDRFYYSPAFATAMVPLAELPDRAGGALWAMFNLAAVFAALSVFCREVVQRVRPEIRAGPFLALSIAATIHGGWSGQANALVLALVLFATVAALRAEKARKGEREKGRGATFPSLPISVSPFLPCSPAQFPFWWTAALLLAAAAHIKIWAAVVPALLALRWFKPLIPRFLAAAVLVGLVPLLTKPPAYVVTTYLQWFSCLVQRMASGSRWDGYRDAWTIWEVLAPPVNRQLFSAMSLAAALVTAAWCYRQARMKQSVGQIANLSDMRQIGNLPHNWADARFVLSAVAAWACWQLLFGPGSERLTYGIIAPAVSWAVCESFLAKRHRALALAAWLLTGVLGAGEVEGRIQMVLPIASLMLPLGLVLLAAWLARHSGPSVRLYYGVARAHPIHRDLVPPQTSGLQSREAGPAPHTAQASSSRVEADDCSRTCSRA